MAGKGNSSVVNSWQDKITSKLRNCLQLQSSVNEKSEKEELDSVSPLDKMMDRVFGKEDAENDTSSLEWHTPCEEIVYDDDDRLVKSPTGPRVYRAIYPYTAVSMDELSLQVGDVVVLVQQNTADRGWWLGEHQPTARTGLFPANYVEILNRSRGKKTLSQTSSTSSEQRPPIRPGRLTALEHELAALAAKLEATPSRQQLKTLEAEVDRLKNMVVTNSPITSPICQDTPILLHQQKTIPMPSSEPAQRELENKQQNASFTENSQPIERPPPNLTKAVTEAAKPKTKPGQVKVPACFSSSQTVTSKTPTSQLERNRTPLNETAEKSAEKAAQSALNKNSFKPAAYGATLLSGRSSTSPASTHAVAVRVNAVTPLSFSANVSLNNGDAPNSAPTSKTAPKTPSSTIDEDEFDRKAGLSAASKLKRRSITHYTKKCQRNFSKLCNFYEGLAESQRLGFLTEKRDCSSTSPSSVSTTTVARDQSVDSSANLGQTRRESSTTTHNRSKDNPFNNSNRSIDSTVVVAKSPSTKRFPAFCTSPKKGRSEQQTVSSVLMAKKIDKAATVSAVQSPGVKDVRRPPMRSNKFKTTVLSTPQPDKAERQEKTLHARCSSATSDADFMQQNEARRESVNDLRRRFEGLGLTCFTNSGTTNLQPQEKRSRQCHQATPTSSSGRRRSTKGQRESGSKNGTPIASVYLQSKTGKDSGLGLYGPSDACGLGVRQGTDSVMSSAADLFNIAQTSQAFAGLEESSSSASPAFSTSSSINIRVTEVSKADKTLMKGDGGRSAAKSSRHAVQPTTTGLNADDAVRCSSASLLNEAGIFDCSLTWTESSSESAGDHHERLNVLVQQHTHKMASNGRVVEVDTIGAAV